MYHIKHLKEHIGLKTFIPIFIRLYFSPCKLVQLVKRILPSKIYINFLLLKDNINIVNLYRHILLRLILNKRGHCVDSQQFFLCSIPLKLCNYLRCCYKSSIYSIHSLEDEVITYVKGKKSFNFFSETLFFIIEFMIWKNHEYKYYAVWCMKYSKMTLYNASNNHSMVF